MSARIGPFWTAVVVVFVVLGVAYTQGAAWAAIVRHAVSSIMGGM